VLLKRAEQNASAKALWVYLRSGKARAIIQAHGYHP
jgi:ABC-type molybdate transport system substrate-binding protein